MQTTRRGFFGIVAGAIAAGVVLRVTVRERIRRNAAKWKGFEIGDALAFGPDGCMRRARRGDRIVGYFVGRDTRS